MSRPPWWRPFARRRWDREVAFPIGIPMRSARSTDEHAERWREMLADRSDRLREKLNAATDAECVDADARNGTPMFSIQRVMRNRDGEQ